VLDPLDGVGPTVGTVLAVDPAVLTGDAIDDPTKFVAYTVATMRSPTEYEKGDEVKTLIATVHSINKLTLANIKT
jgi:hypothetical protein